MSSTLKGAIQSMTGYGRAVKRTAIGSIAVELRSTNHRYLEIEQHLPSGLTALQGRLSELIRSHIRRGRIETFVSVQLGSENQRAVTFDEPLLQRYHAALVELKGRFGLKDHVTLDHLLSLPQALTISEGRIPPERLWEPIRETVRAAARELVRARSREGANLTADLRRQVRSMERHLGAIERRLPKALAGQRRRLRERLRELLGSGTTVSTGQLEQAVALVKEADVHEELVRLESHVAYMRQTLAAPPPASARRKRAASVEVAFGNQAGGGVGKRLDFIAQELIREANTMGAKVNDPEAVQHVVDIKGCIERIREQVQNLE